MNKIIYSCVLIVSSLSLPAQTLSDGLMMPKKDFCTGFLFTHDQWKNYWEGTLKRDNGNIGTIATNQVTYMGAYGVTDKLNIIAMLPYVWTKASQGVLSNMSGVQDLTLGAKYNFLKQAIGTGEFTAFGVGSYSTPVTNYTPDFLPLSIGLAAQRLSGRLILNHKLSNGLYFTGSAAYTWRSNVTLDRPSYFTDGQIIFSNEVWMPNVFDFAFSAGYLKNSLNVFLTYSQQNTLGGGDIRRQDVPFVSNRMNFSKVDATVMYYLPKPKGLAVRAAAGYTVAGRNVGQSTYAMGGLLYTFHFAKN